jgi:hypothetical protein
MNKHKKKMVKQNVYQLINHFLGSSKTTSEFRYESFDFVLANQSILKE